MSRNNWLETLHKIRLEIDRTHWDTKHELWALRRAEAGLEEAIKAIEDYEFFQESLAKSQEDTTNSPR